MRSRLLLSSIFCLLAVLSCEVHDDISNIEKGSADLKEAYNKGLNIVSISLINHSGNGGWQVLFSDNTYLELLNAASSMRSRIPYIKIDDEGFWAVSYNGGEDFEVIKNSEGKPVLYSYKSETSVDNYTVRAEITPDDIYVLNFYDLRNPFDPVDSKVTNATANSANVISAVTIDQSQGFCSILMPDGNAYDFKLAPLSLESVQVKNKVIQVLKEEESVIEIELSPVFANLNEDISQISISDNVEITSVEQKYGDSRGAVPGNYLLKIKDVSSEESYSQIARIAFRNEDQTMVFSSNFTLKLNKDLEFFSFEIEGGETVYMGDDIITVKMPYKSVLNRIKPRFEPAGVKVYVDGEEQVSGSSVRNFSSPVKYTLKSDSGKEKSYWVLVSYSNLPIVYINTKNHQPVISKDDWLKGSRIIIGNTDAGVHDTVYENANIRGRGNSTWYYPKKPFAIKLDSKAQVLGMPKHKRWVLLANWMDKTLLRNAVAFEISNRTKSLAWAPRGEFVEVVLNGGMIGCYYLCEHVKVDGNRVDIKEMKATDISGNSLTGGYLLEFDINYEPGETHFRTVFKTATDGADGLPVYVKDPDTDVIQPQQKDYIRNYLHDLEYMLYDSQFPTNSNYGDYLDIDTYIDYWFVHELANNGEPIHPKSTFMHKDRNGKIKAGPVWDFDWGTFAPNYTFVIKDALWYNRLFLDPAFVARVKEKWNESKEDFRTVPDFIDAISPEIKQAADYNFQIWPINQNVNGDESMTFDNAVQRMKQSYTARFNWLDSQIQQF